MNRLTPISIVLADLVVARDNYVNELSYANRSRGRELEIMIKQNISTFNLVRKLLIDEADIIKKSFEDGQNSSVFSNYEDYFKTNFRTEY